MHALVADGSAVGRISVRDVPEPQPMPGQSLVDVRAISFNRGEWRALRSAPDGYRPGWTSPGMFTMMRSDSIRGVDDGSDTILWHPLLDERPR